MRYGTLCTAALVVLLAGCPKKKDATADGGTAAGSTSPSAIAPEKLDRITFKKKDPAVGMQYGYHDATEMSLGLTKPKKADIVRKDASEQKVELLAVEGRIVQRVKVTYVEKSETEIDDGKETIKKPLVRGHTYFAEAKAGKIEVRDENRRTVKKEESDVVSKDYAEMLGKPDKLLAALPDVPVKVGDSANGLAEWVKDGLVQMGNIDIKSTSVKLDSVATDARGNYGVFAVKAKVTLKVGALSFDLDLTGHLDVREDGRPQAFELAGPLAVKGGGAEGTGKLSFGKTIDFGS
jgi:hypothetical protein